MDTTLILSDLRTERNRLDQAIAALESLDSTGNHTVRRGRQPATVVQPPRSKLVAVAVA